MTVLVSLDVSSAGIPLLHQLRFDEWVRFKRSMSTITKTQNYTLQLTITSPPISETETERKRMRDSGYE